MKTLKIFILLLLFFCSCSQNENITQAEHQANLLNYIEKNYNVQVTSTVNGYKLKYTDSRYLLIENLDDKTIISGTKINNDKFELSIDEGNSPIYKRIDPYFQKENNGNNKQNFILTVNSYQNLNGSLTMNKPCDEHPSEEEFDDCFEREWDEFCDGFIGCMAQITNGPLIAAVIAIHCAACGGDEE